MKKIENYEFELKGFKYLESRSRETHCFSATLYINGKRFAVVGNDGHGGCHDIDTFPECRELEREINALLKRQPKTTSEHFPGHEFDVDLETVIDDLIDEILEAKEIQRLKNKAKTCLVFKDTEGGYYTIKWKYPLEVILKSPNGAESVKKAIAENVAEGNTLINDNIPAELLPKTK